jgi:hypothetical protein
VINWLVSWLDNKYMEKELNKKIVVNDNVRILIIGNSNSNDNSNWKQKESK